MSVKMSVLRLLSLVFITATTTTTTTEEKTEDTDERKQCKYDISKFKRGDLLEVPRTLFTHFGIYLGKNRVAHLIPDILPAMTSDSNAIAKMVTDLRLVIGVIAKVASVRVDTVEDFAYGAEILVNHMDEVCSRSPFHGDEVGRRAEKLLGSVTYSLLWYNCEHYVMYCRYGTVISFQTYQFCKTVRKIFCSKTASMLTMLLGVFILVYLDAVSLLMLLAIFVVSFTIWMAS
ncbi:lecithin retinol acyltransferase b, tandem duplicate 2 [Denticeps clupeoides]|uniref:LRAT domain-containing protein n=1 Tax=Denticeps clupeoides TaxID=299321 RepID=A0AAY4CYT5_9TELE|nr:lecithin retinol acyltransferase-like [Denticeps clupeoides]